MTNTHKYGSVSLRRQTLSKLKDLSSQFSNGRELSIPKTVEKLIDDKICNSQEGNGRITNEETHRQKE
jgi:hypothetical protein